MRRKRIMLASLAAVALLLWAAGFNSILEVTRRPPVPSLVTRSLPGVSNLFSRAARGTWDVGAPADRIDLPNGRRYYLGVRRRVRRPDLSGYVTTGTAIWPDRAWYVQRGDKPSAVWVQGPDGTFSEYGMAGSW